MGGQTKNKFSMKELLLFAFAVIFSSAGCNSSKVDVPNDMYVKYFIKGSLIKYETTIELTKDNMKLAYLSSSTGKISKFEYTTDEAQVSKVYNFVKTNKLLLRESPKPDLLPDAPEENFVVTYGGKSNTIDFGSVKEKPAELQQLKNMLFDIAEKYKPGWKKDAGLE